MVFYFLSSDSPHSHIGHNSPDSYRDHKGFMCIYVPMFLCGENFFSQRIHRKFSLNFS